MKQLLYLLVTFCMFSLFSCQKSDDGTSTPSTNVDTILAHFHGDVTGIDAITINNDLNWKVTVEPAGPSWFRFSIKDSSGHKNFWIYALSNNETLFERRATISLSSISDSAVNPKKIIITQDPIPSVPYLIAVYDYLPMGWHAGPAPSLIIHSNIKWKISSATNWLTLSDIIGNISKVISVTANEDNNTGADRIATITIQPVDNKTVRPVAVTVVQSKKR